VPAVKVAVVSHVLPPTWSGQAMILGRLLRGIDPERYVLARTMNLPIEEDDYEQRLPAKTVHLPESHVLFPWTTWRLWVANVRGLRRVLRARARGIAEVVRREQCDAIVACTGGDMLDLPAACLAARKTGARFYPYLFDHWAQQSQGGARTRRIAEWLEPRILRRSSSVIVPNEFLARELRDAYGVQTAIVRNAASIPDEAPTDPPRAGSPASVVYTGAVYAANHDTFRNLVEALALTSVEARAQVYTAQTREALADAGVEGPVDVHPHVPNSYIPTVHAGADVLFLPLAFDSPYPSLIRTSNPGKMGEYLASGRPILVHAPADTFLASYFREHGCGVVVDRLEPGVLAEALDRLIADDSLRREVTRRAWERAVADYDVRVARRAFVEAVGLGADSVLPLGRDTAPAAA
jgi:glycosyltransferase involved in cell wall biosynthesis